MGAGKGHILRKWHQEKKLDLNSFIINDSDQLKSLIPEAMSLSQANPLTASTLLHQEASILSDILFWEALLKGYSNIIDGTLKDTEWFLSLFAKIRHDFPSYRIEILYVTADPDAIRERCAKRGLQTGRYIPDAVIEDALLRVPDSVRRLSQVVDRTTHVVN